MSGLAHAAVIAAVVFTVPRSAVVVIRARGSEPAVFRATEPGTLDR